MNRANKKITQMHDCLYNGDHRGIYPVCLIVRGSGKDLGQPTVRLLNPHQEWLMVFQLENRNHVIQQRSIICVMKPKNAFKDKWFTFVYANYNIKYIYYL